jgi:hypothetical protein
MANSIEGRSLGAPVLGEVLGAQSPDRTPASRYSPSPTTSISSSRTNSAAPSAVTLTVRVAGLRRSQPSSVKRSNKNAPKGLAKW